MVTFTTADSCGCCVLNVKVTLKLLESEGVIDIFDSRGGGVGGAFKFNVFGGCGLCCVEISVKLLFGEVLLPSLELLTPNDKGSFIVVLVGNLNVLVFPTTGLKSVLGNPFDEVGLNMGCVLFNEKLLIVDMVSDDIGDKQLISFCSIVFELKKVSPTPLLVSVRDLI